MLENLGKERKTYGKINLGGGPLNTYIDTICLS
jgi:hypothetical protein